MFNWGKIFKKSNKNIWQKLKLEKAGKISILAPMLDVTDKPFRQIVADLGAPDIFFTEFVSVDGLCSEGGRERLYLMLKKTKHEKKNKNLVFQLFGSDPDKFFQAIKIIKKFDPAGIDINTGCPDKAVIKQGSGSALINDPERFKKIFLASKKAAGNIPMSIKTRIGFNQIDLDWIKFLLKLKPQALIVHLRTRKEMSKVPAHWELAEQINKMREKISPETVLIGNGDIESKKEGEEKLESSGFDGYMVGRGIFYNPALFEGGNFDSFLVEKKIEVMFSHLDLFEEEFYKKDRWVKTFALMKKFFKIYINGFGGAKTLRTKLMEEKTISGVKKICQDFLENNV